MNQATQRSSIPREAEQELTFTTYHSTFAVAKGERALWEILLTDKRDTLFGDYPVRPRDLEFCPTVREVFHYKSGLARPGKLYEMRSICFTDTTSDSKIYLNMLRDDDSGKKHDWVPHSIRFNRVPIRDPEVRKALGNSIGILTNDLPLT